MRLATELAGHLGYTGRVDYRLGDFALMHAQVPEADVVVLDRSVCCYPDWEGLIRPSAEHARRLYALVLPVDRWFARAMFRAANVLFRLLRWEYRGYMHPRGQIESAINTAGLRRVFTNRDRPLGVHRLRTLVARISRLAVTSALSMPSPNRLVAPQSTPYFSIVSMSMVTPRPGPSGVCTKPSTTSNFSCVSS